MKSKKQGAGMTLLADYIFYLLPFVILLIARIAEGRGAELFLVSDWSIASTIMYGHLIVKLSAALASTSKTKRIPAVTLYLTILVCLGLVVNVVVYVLMLLIPSIGIGIAQLILFGLASLCHFVFGTVVWHINNAEKP